MVERVPTFRQPNAIFSAPFFIEKVDLDKIQLESEEYNESFLSGIKTTMGKDRFSDESYHYVSQLIFECIGQFLDKSFYIGQVWRNKYNKEDWQDPHIHSGAQWSFVIYETVEHSKTVFMNPSRKVMMNQWGMYTESMMMDFIPQVPAGHIIIFPSWIEHFVTSGNEGTTVSGNVYLQEPPSGP